DHENLHCSSPPHSFENSHFSSSISFLKNPTFLFSMQFSVTNSPITRHRCFAAILRSDRVGELSLPVQPPSNHKKRDRLSIRVCSSASGLYLISLESAQLEIRF